MVHSILDVFYHRQKEIRFLPYPDQATILFPILLIEAVLNFLPVRKSGTHFLASTNVSWLFFFFYVLLSIPAEKAMAPHSSTLAWKIPWMEKSGELQSMGSLRVGHDWATSLSLFTLMHWRRKWQCTPVFLPGESQGWGSLVSCRLWGRTESWTWLKRLSSSSIITLRSF